MLQTKNTNANNNTLGLGVPGILTYARIQWRMCCGINVSQNLCDYIDVSLASSSRLSGYNEQSDLFQYHRVELYETNVSNDMLSMNHNQSPY